MKRRLESIAIAVLLIVLAVLCADGATNAPMAKTVWISATNVIGKQTGTMRYPYDGSTQPKFDTLHRNFPQVINIEYLEGHFYTTGSASYNAQGYYVKKWRMRGRGMFRTFIHHVPQFPESGGNALGVFEDDYQNPGGVTVANMTIDENGFALVGRPGSTFAVRLHGSRNTIDSVRAIHGCGNRAANTEWFSLTGGSHWDGEKWADDTGNTIANCLVEQFLGDYGTAIGLVFGADGYTGSSRGTIRSNFVRDVYGTSAFGLANYVTLVGNTASNVNCGIYTDTGQCKEAKVLNNTIYANWGIHFNPNLGAAIVDKVDVEGNTITSTSHGIAMSANLGPRHIKNIGIRKNIFRGSGAAIVAAYVDGLAVEDNLVADGLPSTIQWPQYPSTRVTSKRNYRLPAPVGLEDTF